MGYMKNSFETWIKEKTRSNGAGYSKETISGYVSSLKTHASKLTDISLVDTDLFGIDNINDFEQIYEKIKGSSMFPEINRSYHRIFSSALIAYQDFLSTISTDEMKRNDMRPSFEDWMKKYPDHKYTESTVKRYIRALQKAEDWLGIVLPKQVLDIVEQGEFAEIEAVIKNTDNYTEINQSHGHGDLSAALAVYKKYLISISNDSITVYEEWWPSLKDYDPGISKERWLQLLNNPNIIGPVWGGTLAMFYTMPEGATCSELGEKFGRNAASIRGSCTQMAQRIYKEIQCPLADNDGKKQYWPILFVGKSAEKTEKGNYIWKLRSELYEALKEFRILRYLPKKEGEEEVIITKKEALNAIKKYIASSGFSYSGNLIENFYLSLKSKPFVILAGTSGTGKTRLVKLFAEAIDAKYKLVPVRPDWSDSSDLFGYVDLNGHFVPGVIIDFIKEAQQHPSKPYFLCLDEMNLARVEYYLSDFLSVIETRDMIEGRITSEPLIDVDKYGSDAVAKEKYGRIEYPANLYVVGTVNMDETTFPFSKKVLDRANTIEFSYVDLISDFSVATEKHEPIPLPNQFLRTEYMILKDCADQAEYITGVCTELQRINQILQKAYAHVGYRVRDEIVFYMLNNKDEDEYILDENEALDNAIMQKILPRIQGSSASVRDMLCGLFKVCGSDHEQKTVITILIRCRRSLRIRQLNADIARVLKSCRLWCVALKRTDSRHTGYNIYYWNGR